MKSREKKLVKDLLKHMDIIEIELKAFKEKK